MIAELLSFNVRAFLILLPLLLLVGCGNDDPTEPIVVIPDSAEAVLFSRHVLPIFQTGCAGSDCHIGEGRSAGLSLDSWNDLVSGSDYGSVVIPGYPSRSHLFQHINVDTALGPTAVPRMPLGRDPLPLDQILTIRRWIAEGAKNDQGEMPLAGSDRPRAFITCQSEDLVAVVDLVTGHLARYFSTGVRPDATSAPEAPHNIALSPDGAWIYVNHIASGLVQKFDAATFEAVGSVTAGLAPAEIQVSPDGSRLYVSNFDNTYQQQFISVVDAATMTLIDQVDVEAYAPHGVLLSASGEFLYTMNAGSDNVSVIDLATHEVIDQIPMQPGAPPAPAGSAMFEPYQAVEADGNLWVTCRKSGEVRVVDLAQRRVVDSIDVGVKPLIPGLSPDGSSIWIPNQASNTISIISIDQRRVVRTIDGLDDGPHAVRFYQPEGIAIVSCENQTGGDNLHHPIAGTEVTPGIVYLVEMSDGSIRESIEVAGFAAGVAVRP